VPLLPEHAEGVATLLPWTEAMARRTDQPAAYVCRDFACLTPARSAEEFAAQLGPTSHSRT
jgi:uncharacterized protein YyaL (SSP411 family)